MEITKEVAENCVAWINNNIPMDITNAYIEVTNKRQYKVYIAVGGFHFELSKDEIYNRAILWQEYIDEN